MGLSRTILRLALLLAVLASPAAAQMALLHQVPTDGIPLGLAATDNATLIAVPTGHGVSLILGGYPAGKWPVADLVSFALAPDGSRSFAGTRGAGGGEVVALDDQGAPRWTFRVGSPVTNLSSTSDHRVLYAAGDVAGLLGADGNELAKRSLPGLRALSASPGGSTLLAADPSSVLSLDSGTLGIRWQVPVSNVLEVKAWDGGGVALDSAGNLYRFDDSGRFIQVKALPGPGTLASPPDGALVAAAGGNEVVLLGGDLQVAAREGLQGPVALAFSPDGSLLVVASRDSAVHLFGLSDRYPQTPAEIGSTPAGAVVTVDGVFRGVTPARIPLERGSHVVELTLGGFAPNRATLQVEAGGEKLDVALAAASPGQASGEASGEARKQDGGPGIIILPILIVAVALILLRRRRAARRAAGAGGAPPPPRTAAAPPGSAPAPPPPSQSPARAPPPVLPVPDLPPGTSAIVQERRPGYAYGLFRSLVASGAPGLAITRRDPRKVREEIPGAEVYWLSSLPGERNLRPVDLELLLSAVEGHLGRAEGAAVLLEGIEYLKLHRGFTPILKLVNHLQERTASHKGRLLVAVGAESLDPREAALLKGEGRARGMEEPPGGRPSPAGVSPGSVHLLLEKGPDGAYRRLKEWASGGRKILAVSRSSPEEVRQRHGLGPGTRAVWLTTSKGPDRVDPSDLELLLKMLRDFLEEGEDRAVLLEGVDHIAAIASFAAVQRLLGHLVDLCATRQAVAFVPLDPYALEPAKVAYLRRELTVLEGR